MENFFLNEDERIASERMRNKAEEVEPPLRAVLEQLVKEYFEVYGVCLELRYSPPRYSYSYRFMGGMPPYFYIMNDKETVFIIDAYICGDTVMATVSDETFFDKVLVLRSYLVNYFEILGGRKLEIRKSYPSEIIQAK